MNDQTLIDVGKLKTFLKTACRFGETEADWALYWIKNFMRMYPAWESNREQCFTAYTNAVEEKGGNFKADKARSAVRALYAFVDLRQETASVALTFSSSATQKRTTHTAVANSMGDIMRSVREYLKVKHYAFRTQKTYLGWIRPFCYGTNRGHQLVRKKMKLSHVQSQLKTSALFYAVSQ